MEKYRDRSHAGAVLATYLKEYAGQSHVIVLALPRGGVPVAYALATALAIALDVFMVRKLGVPGHEELAMGAIASGGTVIFNEPLINQLHLDKTSIDAVLASEQKELVRREQVYRGDHRFPELRGKTLILIDDGMATGATMYAAIKALRKYTPARILIAVPVATRETCEEMSPLVDKIICPLKPIDFHAVGLWYENFSQTTDSEVIDLLKKSHAREL